MLAWNVALCRSQRVRSDDKFCMSEMDRFTLVSTVDISALMAWLSLIRRAYSSLYCTMRSSVTFSSALLCSCCALTSSVAFSSRSTSMRSGATLSKMSEYTHCALIHFTSGPHALLARFTLSNDRSGSLKKFLFRYARCLSVMLLLLKLTMLLMKLDSMTMRRMAFQSTLVRPRSMHTASSVFCTFCGGLPSALISSKCCFLMELTAFLASSMAGSTFSKSAYASFFFASMTTSCSASFSDSTSSSLFFCSATCWSCTICLSLSLASAFLRSSSSPFSFRLPCSCCTCSSVSFSFCNPTLMCSCCSSNSSRFSPIRCA
mmetsp:Transcript_1108/g.2653  ORF Transcript_1108/g.2653 Transcript_1108/m.2653 type:complete len:318 (-) Transcript_1108:786-1739(-)